MNVKDVWKKDGDLYTRTINQTADAIGLPTEIKEKRVVVKVFNKDGVMIGSQKFFGTKRVGFWFPFSKGQRLEVSEYRR